MYSKKFGNSSFFLNAVPAVVIFITIYLILGTRFVDDAYIYYRYAANWADGYGPVYNIGEYVEGNTNFLWTLILAIGALFPVNLVNLAPLLNLFIGIACLFLMSYMCSFIRFSKPRLVALASPLFCALTYGFYFYGASGMDTLVFSLVLLLCIISLYKSKNTGNYLTALFPLFLLIIVRPEGPLYAIVLLGVLTCFVLLECKKMPKNLFVTIAVFISLIILLFVVRYIVYKELIPAIVLAKGYTTYLIKQVIFEGNFQKFKDFIAIIYLGLKYEAPLFFLGAWIPFIMLLLSKNKNNVLLWLIASCIIINVFISIWAGGDWMPYKRHVISVLPILIIFFMWSADLLIARYWSGKFYKKITLFFAVVLMSFLWIGFFIRPTILAKKPIYSQFALLRSSRQLVGSILRDIPVSTILLTDMAGIIPYYAGPQVYVRDLFGLTDIHNAKYGDSWVMISVGEEEGIFGRTDYTYSFTAPFDIFACNAVNVAKKFINFCQENVYVCHKYRFLKSDKLSLSRFYFFVNTEHPVSTILKEKFSGTELPLDNDLINIIHESGK
ncbi:MAG: hypothetical protein A2W22_06155 [Candidatus Levybacteria bacterium RBG_16_35_11]|nr:MAG: hypothetical protein A2W22_06155 [Candidatus Levybacteria bacterium RBG_16_35_11]